MAQVLVRLLIFTAIVWAILLSIFVVNASFLERSVIETFEPSGYELYDNILRYREVISQSGFSIGSFFSISNWSIYLTIFLSSLGAIGGLIKIYSSVQRAGRRPFSSQRRQELVVLTSALTSMLILGTSTVLRSTKNKYILRQLYALEVHLVRFEGILFNSYSVSANKQLLDTFLIYLAGYFARVELLLAQIARVYEFPEREDIQNAMFEATDSIRNITNRGFVTTDELFDAWIGDVLGDQALLDLLKNLELMQEVVRRHIRVLET